METDVCVLIPGSFDPVTRGHMALIERAAHTFREVVVGVFVNPDKHCLYTPEERCAFLSLAVRAAGLSNVRVIRDGGMVADYAGAHGIRYLVKGYRNEKDLAYERRMADFNLARGGIETILWETEDAYREVSSSALREALARGEYPREWIPRGVENALRAARKG